MRLTSDISCPIKMKLLMVHVHVHVYLSDFAKTCSLGFRLDLGPNKDRRSPNPGLAGDSNPTEGGGGGRAASSPG